MFQYTCFYQSKFQAFPVFPSELGEALRAPWFHRAPGAGPEQHQVRARVQGLLHCLLIHLWRHDEGHLNRTQSGDQTLLGLGKKKSSALLPSPSPTHPTHISHRFHGVMKGFTISSMKTKYVCLGIISLHANFRNNRTVSTEKEAFIKFAGGVGGGVEKEQKNSFLPPTPYVSIKFPVGLVALHGELWRPNTLGTIF